MMKKKNYKMKCCLCGEVEIVRPKDEWAACQDCNIVYPVCDMCLEIESGFMCECGGEVMVFGDY